MRPYRLTVRAHWVLFIALFWSFLVQPVYVAPSLIQVVFLSLVVVATAWLYRTIAFDVLVTKTDGFVLAGYVALFSALNWGMLRESITCDELLHAERSVFYLHYLYFLPDSIKTLPYFNTTSVRTISETISPFLLAVIGCLAWSFGSLRKRTQPAVRYGIAFAVNLVIGLVIARAYVPAELHAPLRLLPLFLSQALLGLDDFSFRFPGIVTAALISWVTYRLILYRRPNEPGWALYIGGVMYMIPVVFHVSSIVEPSIWGFAAGVLCLYALYAALFFRDERFLVVAALVVGVGALFRQNAVLLWPAVLGVAIFYRPWIEDKRRFLLPLVFVLPYSLMVSRMGHNALTTAGANPTFAAPVLPASIVGWPEGVRNLALSVLSGIGPAGLVHSVTPLWLLFLVAGLLIVVLRYPSKLNIFYVTLPVGYGMFHAIRPELWALGRYQAEYIAPCIVLTIFVLAIYCSRPGKWMLGSILVVLSAYSFSMNRTIPQDIHYAWWAQKRLSTESLFPYREALGFLQRQDSRGKFIIVGGVPLHQRMIVWLRGFTFPETGAFRKRQSQFEAFLKTDVQLKDFYRFLNDNDVQYFLVQYGDKRELQHRSPTLQRLLDQLKADIEGPSSTKSPIVRQHTFIGNIEGAIDVYERRAVPPPSTLK